MHKLIALVALVGCSTHSPSADDPGGSGSQTIETSVPRPVEDMVEIPAGYYLWDTRGCNERADYERSARPFVIDRRDVNCDDYRACARAGACPQLPTTKCSVRVPHVTHSAATKYCAWRGAELPSTGQWQKAARKDARFTPGGYAPDDDTKCEFMRTGLDANKCLYTSPYGMVVEMMPGFGQWTRDTTCPRDEDHLGMHLVAWLNDRLDVLVAAKDKDYGHFRCARIHP